MFTPMKTVSSQVMEYLKKQNRWVGRGEIERNVVGHNGDTTSRILRYMAEEGDIKKDYRKVVKGLRSLVFYRI